MAFQFMFNFPVLELEIARKNIALMTNDNSLDGDDLWKDPESFKNNIAHGFIVATSLISAFDGILNFMLKHKGGRIVKDRVSNIKSFLSLVNIDKKNYFISNENMMFKKLIDARNKLIHFEDYNQGYSGYLKDIELNGVFLDAIFNQKEMQNHYWNVVSILNKFASYADMNIDFNVEAFTNDGIHARYHMIEMNNK